MSAKKLIAWIVYWFFILGADYLCKWVASISVDLGLLLSFMEGCLAVVYVKRILIDGEF